jgi:hypothetical protein
MVLPVRRRSAHSTDGTEKTNWKSIFSSLTILYRRKDRLVLSSPKPVKN